MTAAFKCDGCGVLCDGLPPDCPTVIAAETSENFYFAPVTQHDDETEGFLDPPELCAGCLASKMRQAANLLDLGLGNECDVASV